MTLDEAHATIAALASTCKVWFKAEYSHIESVYASNIEQTAKDACARFNIEQESLMRISGKQTPLETTRAHSWEHISEGARNHWRQAAKQGVGIRIFR